MRYARTLPATLAVLALAGALALPGCDTDDDEDDSDFAVLQRQDWVVTTFEIDGQDRTTRLDNEYSDGGVLFTFSETEGTGERTFEIVGNTDSQAPNLQINGEIEIDGDDDELDFIPAFDNIEAFDVISFQLLYRFSGSARVVLTAEDNGRDGAEVRNFLLPNSNTGGQNPEVRLVIEPVVQQTGS